MTGGKKAINEGKEFELKVNLKNALMEKYNFKEDILYKGTKSNYLFLKKGNYKYYYMAQNAFIHFVRYKFNLEKYDSVTLGRIPDEVLIIEDENNNLIIKVIEVKFQGVDGSVEDKVMLGPKLKLEYLNYFESKLNKKVHVDIIYTLNKFLYDSLKGEKNKWQTTKKEMDVNKILYFNGNETNYKQNIIKKLSIKNNKKYKKIFKTFTPPEKIHELKIKALRIYEENIDTAFKHLLKVRQESQ